MAAAQEARVEVERNITAYFAHELRNPLSAVDSAIKAMPDPNLQRIAEFGLNGVTDENGEPIGNYEPAAGTEVPGGEGLGDENIPLQSEAELEELVGPIALYPDDGGDVQSLLKHADAAM